jgi:hypothetical protein
MFAAAAAHLGQPVLVVVPRRLCVAFSGAGDDPGIEVLDLLEFVTEAWPTRIASLPSRAEKWRIASF